MTAVAGEVADGLLVHAFCTERYLREVTLPALCAGLNAAGRSRADVEVSMLAMIATGDTEEEMARAVAGTRRQIAFYGSTPAYRGVLYRHGWPGSATSSTRCRDRTARTNGRPWAASSTTTCCTPSRS